MKKAGRPKGSRGISSKRQAIVDAAVAIILEEGIHKLTFRKVSARADVSPGTITYYFEGLDRLVGEAASAYVSAVGGLFNKDYLRTAKCEEVENYLAMIASGEIQRESCSTRVVMELYWFVMSRPGLYGLLQAWRNTSIEFMASRFGKAKSVFLYAYLEGAIFRGCVSGEYPDLLEARSNISTLMMFRIEDLHSVS